MRYFLLSIIAAGAAGASVELAFPGSAIGGAVDIGIGVGVAVWFYPQMMGRNYPLVMPGRKKPDQEVKREEALTWAERRAKSHQQP